jgi:hypothetical protein
MTTLDSRTIVNNIIKNNGQYVSDDPTDFGPPDPLVTRIVQYTSQWGNTCWGVTDINHDPEYYMGQQDAKIIWEYEGEPNDT